MSKPFDTEPAAVACIAEHAAGGLRFHDLRHSYATWLVDDSVPINTVQKAMGHERLQAMDDDQDGDQRYDRFC